MRDEVLAKPEAAPQRHRHHHPLPPSPTSTTTAAFTIVPLTDALLRLLVPVEAASYPESFCEGVRGYAKRLHATPACPSFVCLQRTRLGTDDDNNDQRPPPPHHQHESATDVAALVASGDVAHLRAIGYVITCRMPRRSASALEVGAVAAEATVVNNKAAKGDDGKKDDDVDGVDVRADTLYVHDMAVHPDFRCLGVAGALWRRVEETRVALQLKRMSLVAVFGASAFWTRHGFREVSRKALPAGTVGVLEKYGDHAVFMERED